MSFRKDRLLIFAILVLLVLAIYASGLVKDRGVLSLPEPTSTQFAEGSLAITQTPTSVEDGSSNLVDPVSAQQGKLSTFLIVPEESQASYVVQEEFFAGALSTIGIQAGEETAVGVTSEIEGGISLGLSEPRPTLGPNEFVVDLRTLTSDQPRRDQRIRQNDLESNRFPFARFVATEIVGFPQDYVAGEPVSFQLVGEMTIREITNPLTFDVVATLNGDTLTGAATSYLLMQDYGFDPPNILNILAVIDGVTVTLEFTAREGAP